MPKGLTAGTRVRCYGNTLTLSYEDGVVVKSVEGDYLVDIEGIIKAYSARNVIYMPEAGECFSVEGTILKVKKISHEHALCDVVSLGGNDEKMIFLPSLRYDKRIDPETFDKAKKLYEVYKNSFKSLLYG